MSLENPASSNETIMTTKTIRRLPDGTITTNAKTYLKTWKALADKVLVYFPGYVLASFNPGFAFEKRVYRGDLRGRIFASVAEYTVVDSFRFSVESANTLVAGDKA